MPRWARWVIAGLLSCLALSAQAQLPKTQCVSTALASGTGDAIAIPLLPCTETTTLLILTLTAPNSTTSPAISVNGQTPHTILNFDGTSLPIGFFQANQRRELTYNGLNWIVLNGTASSSLSPCGRNPSANLGFFPVLIKTTDYSVQLTDQCSFIVYEGGGSATFTLPSPTAGFVFWVVNLSASNLTLQPPIGHVNLETSLIVPAGSGGMLNSDGTPDSWFFAFSPPGGGGGGCGGSNGVVGQDCVSTGGSGGVWAQEVIGAPGQPGSTTTIQGGNATASSSSDGGPVNITGGSGDTGGTGADVNIASGDGGAFGPSGNIDIATGTAGGSSTAGGITLETSNCNTTGCQNSITLKTGTAASFSGATRGNDIVLAAGLGGISIGAPDTSAVRGSLRFLPAAGWEQHASHVVLTSPTGIAPGLSCTGGGATLQGSDESGDIACTNASTACTLTFSQTWYDSITGGGGKPPQCIVQPDTTSVTAATTARSLTAVTFSLSGSYAGHLFYHCFGSTT